MQLRDKVSHPEMEIIVAQLCRMLGREYEPVAEETGRVIIHKDAILTEDMLEMPEEAYRETNIPSRRYPGTASRPSRFRNRMFELLWGDILAMVSRI